MSFSLIYILLVSLILDLLKALPKLIRRTQSLNLKDKYRYPFYIMKRFYSFYPFTTLILAISSLGFVINDIESIFMVTYVNLLPLIVIYTHPLFIYLPILLPLPLCIVLIIMYRLLPIKIPQLNIKMPSFLLLAPAFFMESISESSLILFAYMLSINFEILIHASLLNLKNYRNRFLLFKLLRVKPFLEVFSSSLKYELKSALVSIILLLTLYGGITRNMFSVFMITLCALVFFLLILDALIHGTYLNSSKWYATKLRQFLARYIPLYCVSCYLSYRIIAALLDYSNVYFDLTFVLIIMTLIVIYVRRIRKPLALTLMIGVLLGCTSQSPQGFVVVDNTPMLFASMKSKETQEISLSPDFIVKVQNGAHVKKGDLLVVDNSLSHQQELKRLNNQLETIKATKTLDKETRKEKVRDTEFEIKLLRDSANHYAQISGTISIMDDTLRVLSLDLELQMEVSLSELPLIQDFKEFKVYTLDQEEIAHTTLKAATPIHHPNGTYYTFSFNTFENTCYPYQSLIVSPTQNIYIVPTTHVSQREGKYYVKDAKKEMEVEVQSQNLNMTHIISPLEEGMVLLAYES